MNKDYSKYFDKILTILTCLKSGSKDYTQLLEDIKAVLIEIDNNTDELEFKIENLTLEAEQINLNTDEVEQLLKDILEKLTDDLGYDLEIGSNVEYCRDNSGVKTKVLSRQYVIFDSKNNAKISEITEWSIDGYTWSTTLPSGLLTIGDCVLPEACKENKTYQILGTRTITFDPDKIYAYKAGVWNKSNPTTPMTGKVTLEEGAGVVAEYGFGDSFGNGDEVNLMPIAVIIKGLDADTDIRISVIQECGYTPTIV
jgi:hypothetical protein